MMGMPNRRSKRLQSSFCSRVTLTVRLLYFAMSSSEAPLCSTTISDLCSRQVMVHSLFAHAISGPGVRLRWLMHVLLSVQLVVAGGQDKGGRRTRDEQTGQVLTSFASASSVVATSFLPTLPSSRVKPCSSRHGTSDAGH